MKYYDTALDQFHKHYQQRLKNTSIYLDDSDENLMIKCIGSPDLKPGNEPRLYLHQERREQVIVMTHGLSDSPYYVTAIARSFFDAGANVILPLMPAHGLKNPDEAMEDFKLDTKWRNEMDMATEVAGHLGYVISLGGFSNGGALSYNKILRDSALINGGLFLFSAAIDVSLMSELGQWNFVSAIAKITDGDIMGYGMDPYKYPKLPHFAALELGQIIHQNEDLSKDLRISQPVFAAHAIADKTALLCAVQNLVENHAEIGVLYTMSNGMAHAELPLEKDIILDDQYNEGKPAFANRDFDLMMQSCMAFYKKYVDINRT